MKEQMIAINHVLQGIMTVPGEEGKTYPLVVFFHGFGTNKNEFGNLFKKVADALLARSILSLRIDFNGYAATGNYSEALSIESLLADATTTIEYALSLSYVAKQAVGLCGFSLGAGIAILAANRTMANISSMALLSPCGDFKADFIKSHTENCFIEMEKHLGPYFINMGWRKAYVHKNLLESFSHFNLSKEIGLYSNPLLLIAGSEDYTANHVETYFRCAASSIKNRHIIKDTNHIFNNHQDKTSSLPQVVDKVVDWYQQTLHV